MRKHKNHILFFVGIVGLILIGGCIKQQQIPEFSLETALAAKLDARCSNVSFKENQSDVILLGNIENVETKLISEVVEKTSKITKEVIQEKRKIDYVFATFSVDNYLKGDGPDKFVLKYRPSLPAPPTFQKGERVKLYLFKTTDGYQFVCDGKETIGSRTR